MKIRGKGNDELSVLRLLKKDTEQASARQSSQSSGAVSGDRVDLSRSGSLLEALQREDQQESRADKVKRIKQLIESGQYNPPAEDVARAVGEEIIMTIATAGEDN
ncbi:MAG: flagellar biosynthesis anti-sigma factor FlgM [Candidatus Dadabacteria bacterium]|nr:MAG: flagellar biosynthesis anti-sigma factor FlgM [Candidatus Dadabacteria bacterium]